MVEQHAVNVRGEGSSPSPPAKHCNACKYWGFDTDGDTYCIWHNVTWSPFTSRSISGHCSPNGDHWEARTEERVKQS